MKNLMLLFFMYVLFQSVSSEEKCYTNFPSSNSCLNFSVTYGTGCAWMCNYCATQLGTNNYYFTDNVCTYQEGVGCVGNPIAGKIYTCCPASEIYFL